jgi:hypothetical protein
MAPRLEYRSSVELLDAILPDQSAQRLRFTPSNPGCSSLALAKHGNSWQTVKMGNKNAPKREKKKPKKAKT